MKRFYFLVFSLCCVLLVSANVSPIDLTPTPTPGPKPLSLIYYPTSATVNEFQLAVYFYWSVGNATITVYNSFNIVVEQNIVNTSDISEVYIPINLWESGVYTLSVSYGNTTVSGEFEKL